MRTMKLIRGLSLGQTGDVVEVTLHQGAVYILHRGKPHLGRQGRPWRYTFPVSDVTDTRMQVHRTIYYRGEPTLIDRMVGDQPVPDEAAARLVLVAEPGEGEGPEIVLQGNLVEVKRLHQALIAARIKQAAPAPEPRTAKAKAPPVRPLREVASMGGLNFAWTPA